MGSAAAAQVARIRPRPSCGMATPRPATAGRGGAVAAVVVVGTVVDTEGSLRRDDGDTSKVGRGARIVVGRPVDPRSAASTIPRSSARMTTAAPVRCSVDAVTDRRRTLAEHGVTLAVALLALAALSEDLASPTVSSGGRTYDRGPEVLIAAVLTAAVVLVALRRRLGVLAPLAAMVLFGLAAFRAPVWLID